MKFRGLILDINGTLIDNFQLLDGVLNLFIFLEKSKIPYILLSNDSTMTPSEWEVILYNLGINISKEKILTSSVITAEFFEKHISKESRIFLIGNYALEKALEKKGFDISQNESYDIVLMGSDKNLDFEKINKGAIHINNGAKFFVTNSDKLLLSEGKLFPGNGSLAKVLETATSIKPINIGKPSKFALDFAINMLRMSASDVVILGDNPETDIAGANDVGMQSVLIKTGLSNIISTTIKPDFIFNNLNDFLSTIQNSYNAYPSK